MPRSCIPCMCESLKELILEFTDDPQTVSLIKEMVDCPKGSIMNLCISPKGEPIKRAPSQYQLFISSCLKSKPIKGKPFGAAAKYMKECSAEWRARTGG